MGYFNKKFKFRAFQVSDFEVCLQYKIISTGADARIDACKFRMPPCSKKNSTHAQENF